jgi:hypothetical protein
MRKSELFAQSTLKKLGKPVPPKPPGVPLTEAQRAYRKWLRSDEWRAQRSRILKRDSICVVCRRRRSTQIHHKVYGRVGYMVPDEMLEGRCGWDHRQHHRIENEIENQIKQQSKGYQRRN